MRRLGKKTAPKISFPILFDRRDEFPRRSVCGWCKKRGTPHQVEQVGLGFEALLKDPELSEEEGDDVFLPSDELAASVRLSYVEDHGIVDETILLHTNIARNVIGGQGCVGFCSTDCLREFLCFCVDDLDGKIKKEKRRIEQDKKKATSVSGRKRGAKPRE